jgi:branched-chain amino acid transport system ATP-binding protein
MTVYENVLTGGVYGRKLSEREAEKNAVEILALIGLRDSAYKKAGKLGLLDRKRLEIGIALASRPKLILLDEVAGGLTNSEVAEIMKIVETIKAQGLSVIWIEHVMQTMIEGTDRVMLLSDGRDILTATAPVIMVSREVSEVYLGAEDDE